jgi:hypothetical protein
MPLHHGGLRRLQRAASRLTTGELRAFHAGRADRTTACQNNEADP